MHLSYVFCSGGKRLSWCSNAWNKISWSIKIFLTFTPFWSNFISTITHRDIFLYYSLLYPVNQVNIIPVRQSGIKASTLSDNTFTQGISGPQNVARQSLINHEKREAYWKNQGPGKNAAALRRKQQGFEKAAGTYGKTNPDPGRREIYVNSFPVLPGFTCKGYPFPVGPISLLHIPPFNISVVHSPLPPGIQPAESLPVFSKILI